MPAQPMTPVARVGPWTATDPGIHYNGLGAPTYETQLYVVSFILAQLIKFSIYPVAGLNVPFEMVHISTT